MRRAGWVVFAALTVSSLCLAQRGSYRDRRGWRVDSGYSAPEILADRRGVPTWERDSQFPRDDFRFVRVMFNASGSDKWRTDWPDSDLNFSFRLQQLTALKVDPDPLILELSDPRIFDYPWMYIIEPGGGRGWGDGGLNLSDEEVLAFRTYCDNGGLVMVDDFWGEEEWEVFYHELKKVFPDREPVDLAQSHEIFNCVYQLDERPQVPSIHAFLGGARYERYDAEEVHYRAIYDDRGRPQVIICHNTDLGDGWEREGENVQYFKEYSEPKSYPMGINILFYAMTH